MSTFTAFTTLPGKAAAERLGAAIETLDPAPTGVGVFEVEDQSGTWEVGGYFEAAPDETALALLAAALDAAPFRISELPETDWVAHVKRTLAPVAAGRFFVHGTHDADKVPAQSLPLLIEASMAFGTGHHGTTLGCLTAFNRLLDRKTPPGAVADIGCGTAILAMAAAQLWPGPIIASDLDPVAVEVARANLAANDLLDRVECVEAAGFDHPALRAKAPYALIFANILKGPLIALAEEISSQLAPQGHVILSGILTEQAEAVRTQYQRFGNNVVDCIEIGEWSTLTLEKSVGLKQNFG